MHKHKHTHIHTQTNRHKAHTSIYLCINELFTQVNIQTYTYFSPTSHTPLNQFSCTPINTHKHKPTHTHTHTHTQYIQIHKYTHTIYIQIHTHNQNIQIHTQTLFTDFGNTQTHIHAAFRLTNTNTKLSN
jgi:hypothetical protein